jgi:hypothetical protein
MQGAAAGPGELRAGPPSCARPHRLPGGDVHGYWSGDGHRWCRRIAPLEASGRGSPERGPPRTTTEPDSLRIELSTDESSRRPRAPRSRARVRLTVDASVLEGSNTAETPAVGSGAETCASSSPVIVVESTPWPSGIDATTSWPFVRTRAERARDSSLSFEPTIPRADLRWKRDVSVARSSDL